VSKPPALHEQSSPFYRTARNLHAAFPFHQCVVYAPCMFT
jgi:hypothetical protein